MKKNYKLHKKVTGAGDRCRWEKENYRQKNKGSHGLHQDSLRLQTMTALIKSFCGGGLNQWVSGSVGQWVSSMIGKYNYESLIMMPRPHPKTKENQHKRFAQHIGSPRRGALAAGGRNEEQF
jgi:hypothetical protein